MKSLLTFSVLFLSIFNLLSAQTKLIAHKSHSGSKANFKTALVNDLFDMSASDFGETPEMLRSMSLTRLDSVIRISDTKVIVVTSTLPEMGIEIDTNLIKIKHDTVYQHPLFQHYHSLDSIITVLRYDYYYQNPPQNVIFVGYDNVKPELKPEPELEEKSPEEEEIIAPPTKKQIRKAKKELKQAKKKERKAKKDKQDENTFVPVSLNFPVDPPANHFPLKMVFVFVLGGLLCIWLTHVLFTKLRRNHVY